MCWLKVKQRVPPSHLISSLSSSSSSGLFSLPWVNLEFCSMQNAWFRKSRFKGGKGKKLNIGGGGLGYRERPGLGSENMVSLDYSSVFRVGLMSWMSLGIFSSAQESLSEFKTLSRREFVFNLIWVNSVLILMVTFYWRSIFVYLVD